MFGKDAPPYEQMSEDEDWDPTKRKRREKESDAASTLMTLHDCDKKDSLDIGEFKIKGSLDTQMRRSFFRIPQSAVEVAFDLMILLHECSGCCFVLINSLLSITLRSVDL